MSSNPAFDPIFNITPAQEQDSSVHERARYHFDGWSYEPLPVDQYARETQILEPQP